MSEKKTILIIDDDPSEIKILNKWLNVANKNIACANDAPEGLDKAKKIQPDLILLDLMLPGMGGIELTTILQSDPQTKKIPIIFISACLGVEQDKGDEEIHIGEKQYRIFAKPLHNAKLLSEIRKTINREENKKRSK